MTAVLHCKELRPWTSHTFTDTDVVLLASDLDLAAVEITATATARGINGNYISEVTHPVAAPLDLTGRIRDLLDRRRVAGTKTD